ncbi:acetyltransferase (GNAT) family protein [Actinocorallia herbida]|uniref:Acetyltransferase (GNAT) family protein n=1 Tax=Actinocorallia herbida TaxID=58109 RepID=A0A3N1D0V5_9ACTN|nr:GNAT family N-acetyltransferase [Actinocorallia herbida]ROO87136.1 acetyltransferase (GNAT) family protein [Actinocorallia herbida]
MTVTLRRYEGPQDLRAMQGLTQRVWSRASPHHVGDLAWGRFMFPVEDADWPIALWESGGHVVAWGWAQFPDDLRMQVDPGRPGLIEEVLDWFDDLADGGPREISPLDSEHEVRAALLRRGYLPADDDAPFFALHERDLDGLPEPVLPEGFTARAVRGEADLDRRVAVHRASWNSVRVTEGSYRVLMSAWPYRADLDWIAEAPDGRFAGSCLIWYDDVLRVGLIEPVGTDPDFRRRGVSRAVCLAALHALRDAGAERAVVGPRGDAAYPVPQALYRHLGFRPYARTRTHRLTP